MVKRKLQDCVTPPSVTSQGLVRLGNDCLIVMLSFLVVSVDLNDYSKIQRWICIQRVCKQLHDVCHSPQLMGLLNVKVGSVEVLHKLYRRMPGIQRLSCEFETDFNKCYEVLPKFTSLQELSLLCDVTDEVFKNVALCTTLKSLHIRNLRRSVEAFQLCSTLTSLEKLRVSCGLTDQDLSTVALLTNLRDMNISFCSHVSDEGLKKLSHLRLRTLDVSSTSISDVGLCALRLDGLEKLVIYDRRITDACFSHLSSSLVSLKVGPKSLNGTAALVALTSLTELVLLDDSPNGVLQDLSKLTNLRRLAVGCRDCDLRSLSLPTLQSLSLTIGKARHLGALSCLGHLESLKLLLLLGGELDELSMLTGLKELDLSCNYHLMAPALESVSCLKSLRSLDISYCLTLTDESLRWIEQLPQLEVLKFVGTMLNEATVMARLPNVEELNNALSD